MMQFHLQIYSTTSAISLCLTQNKSIIHSFCVWIYWNQVKRLWVKITDYWNFKITGWLISYPVTVHSSNTHAHAHTHMHTHICARMHTCAHVYTCTHTHTHTHPRAYVCTRIHTCTRTRIHMHTHPHTRAYVCACTCMHTYMHAHMYMYKCIQMCIRAHINRPWNFRFLYDTVSTLNPMAVTRHWSFTHH